MEDILIFSGRELWMGGILTGLFLLQLLFLWIVYSRPYRYAKRGEYKKTAEALPPVSIVVYAKNESENLRKNLLLLLTQDYPEYQVVVVNDGSTDESEEVLTLLEAEYKHLYHTYIPEEAKYLSRRKLALTVGIKASKYEILLFTEANCRPISPFWIKSMASNFVEGKSITLGFCSYIGNSGFFHRLVAYDNLLTGVQYLSAALAGSPFTGNGRNLAYRKEEFFRHKGYYHSLSLHAGDDDLFVNEVATGENTQVEYAEESITRMMPIECFPIWKEMKVSRAATQRYYKGRALSRYRFDEVILFLFLVAVIVSVCLGFAGNFLLAVYAVLFYLVLLVNKIVVYNKTAKLLQQKQIVFLFPLLEICSSLFNLYVRIYRFFRGKNDYTFNLR